MLRAHHFCTVPLINPNKVEEKNWCFQRWAVSHGKVPNFPHQMCAADLLTGQGQSKSHP